MMCRPVIRQASIRQNIDESIGDSKHLRVARAERAVPSNHGYQETARSSRRQRGPESPPSQDFLALHTP